jgi:choline dehydrogenase-like flavoprotein
LEALKTIVRTLMIGRRPNEPSKAVAHLAALWPVAGALAWRQFVKKRAFNPAEAGIDFVLTAEQIPLQESRITLSSGVNALGAPNIEVAWKVDGRELAAMADFTERCQAALSRAELADLVIDPALAARDPAFLARATDTYHQMGGARIGASAHQGVVDANLQVHGGENLYVCGAAVFPRSGFANPTFTAMALGLRLCAHLTRAAASAPAAARAPTAQQSG